MTQAFFEGLEASGEAKAWQVLVVDNGSTDATPALCKAWSRRLRLKVIRNARNRGVAPAWNQGLDAALKQGARWVGILNNDLLCGPAALSRCVDAAEARGWDAVSPATREGALSYDFQAYAKAYVRRCGAWAREGAWYGWCFLLSRRAALSAGRFDEGFELGIGEDEDWFRRLGAAGLRCGVTGSAFVHHFGSATLAPLRRRKGKAFEERNLARLRARWGYERPSLLQRWSRGLSLGWDRVRWGHLLKE